VGLLTGPQRKELCVELGTTGSLQRCPYSNNNVRGKKSSGHNTEQMKTGRTEKRKICWVTDLCLIRCEATLVPILTVQSISVDLLSAASRKFLPVFKLLCSVTMHSLFYEDKTHCVTDGSKSKSNPTQKPEITVCKKQNHMEPAMLFCTAAFGFLSVRSPASELSHT
jgi:hypothetical protein